MSGPGQLRSVELLERRPKNKRLSIIKLACSSGKGCEIHAASWVQADKRAAHEGMQVSLFTLRKPEGLQKPTSQTPGKEAGRTPSHFWWYQEFFFNGRQLYS